MTPITIRNVRIEDCPRLLELIRELAEYEKAPHEVTVTLEQFTDAGFGKSPVWKAFAAVDGDQIIGFALYYIRYSTWKGCRMYLEDLLVTESYRGKGIGKMLFDKLLEEARTQNYNGMVWQVLEWNEPAINFYKKYDASFDPEWWNASISF
ncbi:MAG: GCN5-related N-acetyltransferase [Bacteroidetes bacterium]|uniref:GNAT family N-acetyltransferase n=1 Tax=unclassified Chitinophaga TaxID=2619133 RepID=UPI0009CEEDBF|nr:MULTISPECIES: GNAT family N-acetyltransferase [unclassified Chitinophaga]MBP1650585.1 GCN5-related N-acetyltransferase [Bacteroidota bacterium]OMP77190.1 GNAT family N-acetyltransferase [[Flexibacter] sp. ATCC 35208]WPV67369.1 GNAT family N-acetyltransferase [Chitinophaga sp. LS1]